MVSSVTSILSPDREPPRARCLKTLGVIDWSEMENSLAATTHTLRFDRWVLTAAIKQRMTLASRSTRNANRKRMLIGIRSSKVEHQSMKAMSPEDASQSMVSLRIKVENQSRASRCQLEDWRTE